MSNAVRHIAVKTLIITVLTVPLTLAAVGMANASCLFDERSLADKVATAEVVFKGTVVDVAADGRIATFDVEEVWQGAVAARVVVAGGPEGAATSVDRTFTAGATYLVFPQPEDGGRYSDNSCSPTQEYDEQAEAARPATVSEPTGTPAATGTTSGLSLWTWVGVAGLVILAAIAIPVVRQRRAA